MNERNLKEEFSRAVAEDQSGYADRLKVTADWQPLAVQLDPYAKPLGFDGYPEDVKERLISDHYCAVNNCLTKNLLSRSTKDLRNQEIATWLDGVVVVHGLWGNDFNGEAGYQVLAVRPDQVNFVKGRLEQNTYVAAVKIVSWDELADITSKNPSLTKEEGWEIQLSYGSGRPIYM